MTAHRCLGVATSEGEYMHPTQYIQNGLMVGRATVPEAEDQLASAQQTSA